MDVLQIQYHFQLNKEQSISFDLWLEEPSLIRMIPEELELPEWVNLEFEQCSNCPLKKESSPHCPVAVGLVDVVKGFDKMLSYDEVDLKVNTKERCISQHTTVQQGVSSLMGLVMATSGCPHTRFFKPMARFHLPLANEDETVYRATSMYLMSQYFVYQDKGQPDMALSGLSDIYAQLQTVNLGIVARLRAASETDSSINAAIILDMYARTIPMIIEESLDEIRYLFDSYRKD